MFKRVLFVCIGNICRSPLAEAMLASALPKVEVASAGLNALVGYAADEKMQRVAQSYNIDLSQHRAQQISNKLIEAADLTFVMDHQQQRFLTGQYAHLHGRVLLLSQFSSPEMKGKSIEDPYQQSEDVFIECARQISLHVDAIHKTLFSL